MISTWLERLGDVVAPARCVACLQEGSWLCRACASRIPSPTPTCVICQGASPRGLVCRPCRAETSLTGTVSVGTYNAEWLRRGIHWLKFKGVRTVAPTLASLLAWRFSLVATPAELRSRACVAPIPLHARRQRQRGFNQSELLAAALEAETSIPVCNLLTRSRATWTQTKLPRELRRDNLQEAFTLTASLPAATRFVLLVDDVTTTGSTLSAAASVIKHRWPEAQVWGCTLAQG